jgi:membrane-associated phospholipid phosphatase
MSTAPPPPAAFFHWPGWGQFRYVVGVSLGVGVWFSVVYYGAEWVTSLHPYRVRVHLDAELRIPYVPAAVLGYMSLYLPLWMAGFVLRTRREVRALAWTLSGVILVAGVCFLLLPAEHAFPPPPPDMGAWTDLVHFAKWVALEHNLVPSLHVALSTICLAVYARQAGAVGRVLLWSWAAAIALSTLLLHQHYLLDVATGFALGLVGVRLGYDRLLASGTRDGPGAPRAHRVGEKTA